jgi:hypothetical protein
MTTETDIRARIVENLASITDIGVVNNFERFSKRNSDLREQYVYKNQLRGWYVKRMGFREEDLGGSRRITTRWRIGGYMALDDATQSELVFDGLIEQIQAVFRADQFLGDADAENRVTDAAGVQGDDIGPVMFAEVLCHSARLSLETVHYTEGPGEMQRPNSILAQ